MGGCCQRKLDELQGLESLDATRPLDGMPGNARLMAPVFRQPAGEVRPLCMLVQLHDDSRVEFHLLWPGESPPQLRSCGCGAAAAGFSLFKALHHNQLADHQYGKYELNKDGSVRCFRSHNDGGKAQWDTLVPGHHTADWPLLAAGEQPRDDCRLELNAAGRPVVWISSWAHTFSAVNRNVTRRHEDLSVPSFWLRHGDVKELVKGFH